MAFDFSGEYKNYPDLELLKIMRRPDDYQPEAVAAASQILNDRQVATEQLESLHQSLQDQENANREKTEKIERIKARAVTLLSPILQPQKKIEPFQWLSYFLLVIALQYLWTLVGLAKKLIRLFHRENFFWADYIDFFSVFYVPFIFYLLIKKRRWGWILLFADNLASLIFRLSETYIFFKYQPLHHGSTVSFVVPILVRAAFAYFLWGDAIAELFCVNTGTKKRTVLITIGGTFLFMGTSYLVFR